MTPILDSLNQCYAQVVDGMNYHVSFEKEIVDNQGAYMHISLFQDLDEEEFDPIAMCLNFVREADAPFAC